MTESRCGRSAGGAICVVMAAACLSCGSGAARRSSVPAPESAPAGAAAPRPGQLVIAIPDIIFSDSSTEEVDQSAAHEARLRSMVDGLRADVASNKRFAVLSLTCGGASCSRGGATLDDVRSEARAAGARLLLIGGVHKMSTLILWMNVTVVDVASGERVLVRVLSFRGDNDDAWRRAGSFAAKQVAEELQESLPKP
jgi:hypothetical protein